MVMHESATSPAAAPAAVPATASRPQYDGIHLLRAIACFLVVGVHSSEILFMSFSPRWLAAIFYAAFCRASVPVFLIITGFLLLDKEEPIGFFYKKRFTRVVLPFLFYCVLYLIVDRISIYSYITRIYIGAVAPHLWYIYVLIGIYLFLPFLRKIFIYSTTNERMVFLGFWIAFGVIYPTLHDFFDWRFDAVVIYHLSKFTGYMGYVFLGGCLKRITKVNRPLMAMAYVLSAFCIMALMYRYTYKVEKLNSIFIENLSPFVFLTAGALFLWLKDARVTRWRPFVLAVSECSYGIYLLHFMLLTTLAKLHISGNVGSAWLMIPVTTCLGFAITFGIVFTLRKIPFLGRLVG
jgi:surface polysaccharide O-acyltransferase-like enzyme